MREAAKGYLALAGSVTQVTRERATAAARALVAQGEATAEQVGSLVEDVLVQSRQNRQAVTALVRHEVERALARIGLSSDDEVTELVERIRTLEAEVRRLSRVAGAGGAATAAAAAAKKTPAARGSAKKPPAAGAKKPPAAGAKKAPAAGAKKPAVRSTAKKASTGTARKTPATRGAAKQAAGGRPAKKAPAGGARRSGPSGSA